MYTDIVRVLGASVNARRIRKLQVLLSVRLKDTALVFENVSDQSNLAATFRTADAMGIQNCHVISSYAGHSPSDAQHMPKRIDRGSRQWLTIKHHGSIGDCFEELDRDGYIIAATDLAPGSVEAETAADACLKHNTRTAEARAQHTTPRILASSATASSQTAADSRLGSVAGASTPASPFRPRVAIVVGNEHRGVSRAAAEHAHVRFHLPMIGFVQSYNVSVAAALSMHVFLNRTSDYGRKALELGRLADEIGLDGEVYHDRPAEHAKADSAKVRAFVDRLRNPQMEMAELLSQTPALQRSREDNAVERLHDRDRLFCEHLSECEVDEIIAKHLMTSLPKSAAILERHGLRPPDF